MSPLREKPFGTYLKNAINEVNSAQLQSEEATQKLMNGQNIELHDVMITAQKASITMQAALEVRNKAVEAYQEMMRMQV
ncbi:flagellar hook-basal body complex protein FliE [Lederbergia sp. NSJ-179]|uniref:flagellar hook-basal body complex protein FliE n=1 Tax=Lederbergia sp. NSJ-179 TaxID=2931402 RepID=UPI00245803CD|nr:flagellar hook-basal body complex protein FliE [Lederbergia sp. NSJ-179]